MPGTHVGDVAYFSDRREALLRALEADGREPDTFTFAGQLNVASGAQGYRLARETAVAFVRAGAGHVTLGVPVSEGPAAVRRMAREVAEPVRDALGA